MARVVQDLKGCRVFLVEDESQIIMLIEEALKDIGCDVVAIASRVPDAEKKAEEVDYDLAILDVNLNGHLTFDIAHTMTRRGKPFVFATGYGKPIIPQALNAVPVLQKPFHLNDLEAALSAALRES